MLSTLLSQQPMDIATRRKIALLQMLWGSLVVGLALLVLGSCLTSSIPRWVGLIAAVAAAGLAPLFIKLIPKSRNPPESTPSIPVRYRPVGIASAVLGCGLVVHGFVRLYSIQIAATAAPFNVEISLGALLTMVGGIFLARKSSK